MAIEDDTASAYGGYRAYLGKPPYGKYAQLFVEVVESVAADSVGPGKCVKFAEKMIEVLHQVQKVKEGNGYAGLFADAAAKKEFDCKNFAVFAGECADFFGLDHEYVCLRSHMVLRVDSIYLDLAYQKYYCSKEELEKEHGQIFLAFKGMDKLKFSPYENLGHHHYWLGWKRQLLGDTASANEEYDTAARCISRAIEIAPELPGLWKMLGRLQLALGNRSGALEAYKRELALDPCSWDVHYRIGSVYDAMGNYGAALSEYVEAAGLGCRFLNKDIERLHSLMKK